MSYIEQRSDSVESKYTVRDNPLTRIVRTKSGKLVIAVTEDSIVSLSDKR